MVLYTDSLRVVLPHLLLYAATILYSLLGAAIFHRVELPFETEHLKRHSVAIAEAQESLLASGTSAAGFRPPLRPVEPGNGTAPRSVALNGSFNASVDAAIDALIRVSMDAFSEGIRASDLTAMFGVLAALPSGGVRPQHANPAGDPDTSTEAERLSQVIGAKIRPKWNFHSALFFTTTLLTSIGYGNLVPISPFGRIFCICYAFLGIPLTLITIADLAKFFADLLVRLPVVARRWLDRLQWTDPGDAGSVLVPAPNNQDKNADEELPADSSRCYERENSLTAVAGGGGDGQRRASRSNRGGGTRRLTLSDVQYGEAKRRRARTARRGPGQNQDQEEDQEDEEEDGMMSEPGFWTKNLVLALLFLYMAVMALLFTHIQANWNFLDAFYFCLITLVTIGFGDFCPVEESHYGGWIAFIFVGLILSTLTVDLVGSATIERIHTLGRGLDLGSLLTLLGKGGPDSTRLLQQLYAGAYQPSDLRLIPYIDQIVNGGHNGSAAGAASLLRTQDPTGRRPKYCNGDRNEVWDRKVGHRGSNSRARPRGTSSVGSEAADNLLGPGTRTGSDTGPGFDIVPTGTGSHPFRPGSDTVSPGTELAIRPRPSGTESELLGQGPEPSGRRPGYLGTGLSAPDSANHILRADTLLADFAPSEVRPLRPVRTADPEVPRNPIV